MRKAVFVASTGQHIGKTTTCLALVAGAEKLVGTGEVGFCKPVGQKHLVVDGGLKVDKDVVLFKHQFKLDKCAYRDLSPVVIPAGYTRDFLDGKITENQQIAAVERGFRAISSHHKFTVVEGTGHCGVGSIVNLDNARVASILGLSIVLVVNGGLGSAFDDLALNRLACAHHGVKIKGVIVNKVVPNKVDMIKDYFGRALMRWNVPLLGVVPDGPYLSQPSMLDFEDLFKSKLISGPDDVLRHYDSITLVSMDLRRFNKRLRTERHSKTLFVTHASRLDIVLSFISHARVHESIWKEPFQAGLVLAGGGDIEESERAALVDIIRMQNRPVLFSMRSTYETMLLIGNYTAKLSARDPKRTIKAIEHYVPHIDIARIIED
jgi:dethiobiotin synthetase